MAKYYCRIGGAVGDIGEIKYGFNAPAYAYDNIGDELGIIKIDETGANQDSQKGVAYGINYPSPPRVRISYKDENIDVPGGNTNDKIRSAIRFCDPDKLGQVLGGSLNRLKVKTRNGEYQIVSVSMA
jgi:hypothetical protein